MTAAGKFDRRIQLQSATTTPDTSGQPTQTWATFYTCWAAKRSPRQNEIQAAQQPVAKIDVVYEIRYPDQHAATITPHQDVRILDASRTYNIVGVDDTQRRKGLLIISAYGRAEAAA